MSKLETVIRYSVNPSALKTPTGVKLARRLDALALDQLRQVAAEQDEQIRKLTAELEQTRLERDIARDNADWSHDSFQEANCVRNSYLDQLRAAGLQLPKTVGLGITVDGAIRVIQ